MHLNLLTLTCSLLGFLSLVFLAAKIKSGLMRPINPISVLLFVLAAVAIIVGKPDQKEPPHFFVMSLVTGAIMLITALTERGRWKWGMAEVYGAAGTIISLSISFTVPQPFTGIYIAIALLFAGLPLWIEQRKDDKGECGLIFGLLALSCGLSIIPPERTMVGIICGLTGVCYFTWLAIICTLADSEESQYREG